MSRLVTSLQSSRLIFQAHPRPGLFLSSRPHDGSFEIFHSNRPIKYTNISRRLASTSLKKPKTPKTSVDTGNSRLDDASCPHLKTFLLRVIRLPKLLVDQFVGQFELDIERRLVDGNTVCSAKGIKLMDVTGECQVTFPYAAATTADSPRQLWKTVESSLTQDKPALVAFRQLMKEHHPQFLSPLALFKEFCSTSAGNPSDLHSRWSSILMENSRSSSETLFQATGVQFNNPDGSVIARVNFDPHLEPSPSTIKTANWFSKLALANPEFVTALQQKLCQAYQLDAPKILISDLEKLKHQLCQRLVLSKSVVSTETSQDQKEISQETQKDDSPLISYPSLQMFLCDVVQLPLYIVNQISPNFASPKAGGKQRVVASGIEFTDSVHQHRISIAYPQKRGYDNKRLAVEGLIAALVDDKPAILALKQLFHAHLMQPVDVFTEFCKRTVGLPRVPFTMLIESIPEQSTLRPIGVRFNRGSSVIDIPFYAGCELDFSRITECLPLLCHSLLNDPLILATVQEKLCQLYQLDTPKMLISDLEQLRSDLAPLPAADAETSISLPSQKKASITSKATQSSRNRKSSKKINKK